MGAWSFRRQEECLLYITPCPVVPSLMIIVNFNAPGRAVLEMLVWENVETVEILEIFFIKV